MEIKVSEWVSLGHPDKMADFISSEIYDRFREIDKKTRYAVEVMIKGNTVVLGGEITSTVQFENSHLEDIVKQSIKNIGYTKNYCDKWGKNGNGVCNTLSSEDIEIKTLLSQQSTDISQGVNQYGWGDQGIFWGYANKCKESGYMPLDHYFAKRIGEELYYMAANTTNSDILFGLDIKTQVYLETDDVTNFDKCRNGIKEIVVAIPIKKLDSSVDEISIIKNKINVALSNGLFADKFKTTANIIVNGTGSYVMHGPIADCGITGRKLAVDFYGGNCQIGGGSPWTKDPTKADLTLNLLARKIALDTIKNGNYNSNEIRVGLCCCIGKQKLNVVIYNNKNELITTYEINSLPNEIIEQVGLAKRKSSIAKLCRDGLFTDINNQILWQLQDQELSVDISVLDNDQSTGLRGESRRLQSNISNSYSQEFDNNILRGI